jgi:hypothetical protein
VAHHHHRLGVRQVFLGGEAPAQEGPGPDGLDKALGHGPTPEADRATVHYEVVSPGIRHGSGREQLARLCQVPDVGRGDALGSLAVLRIELVQGHHPVSVIVGERTEENGVHGAEHGGRGPDAQGECQNRHQRESRSSHQGPG